MSAIFGGSKQSSTSTSSNQAYPFIKDTYAPVAQQTQTVGSRLLDLLGLGNNSAAAQKGYQDYRNSAGFQSNLDAGTEAINNGAAAHGMFGSGATGKALAKFGTDLNQNYYDNYLNHLMGQQSAGLQAGGLIAGAGQQSSSKSSGSSKPGIGSFLGMAI